MQLFLVWTKELLGLVEGLQEILAQIVLIKEPPLEVLIHLPLERLDQVKEITVQDLMIN